MNDNVGGYGPPRKGRATLPFNLTKPDEQKIVIHFKVMDRDPEVRQRVGKDIVEALRGIVVGEYGLIPIITGEGMELSMLDAALLAKQVVPFVLKAMGMDRVALGDRNVG
jgi:hypothetical protein